MKKFLSIYLNWRNDVLMLIFAISVIMLVCETENLILFAFTKLLAFIGFCLFALLFSYWDSKGEVGNLSDLIGDDE